MSTLCIEEQGAILARKDERFLVKVKGEVIADVPSFRLDQIIIMGNAQVTPDAIKLIFKNNIDTVFMSVKGKLYGRLYNAGLKNVEVRMLQYRKSLDDIFKVKLSGEFIKGKLTNFRNLILKYNRSKDENVSAACFKLRKMAQKTEDLSSVASLLGVEGAGSAIYFQTFKNLLKQDLGFTKRQRRPPKDPVNSMLSFGYTLLYREFSILVNIAGADPYIGFLHSPENGRESLPLDLMEEFRSLVDKIVLKIVNRRMVNESDFTKNKDESVTMNKNTIGILMNAFYNSLEKQYFYEELEENLTLRNIMLNQVRLLIRSLKEEKDYRFFEIR